MKRTLCGLAVVASLSCILPRTARAASNSTPTLTPYIAFAWHPPTQALSHVVGAVWYNESTDPAEVAAALKALPSGQRALLRWNSTQLLLGSSKDQVIGPDHKAYWGPWLPNGAAAEAAFENNYLGEVQKDGASVDYLILDTEWGINTWTLTQGQLNAIKADPRYAALAKTYGVNHTNDLIGNLNNDSRAFALAMQVTNGAYMHEAFDAPLVDRFPNAHCSDFCDGVLPATVAPQAPDANDCVQPTGLPLHGDTQSPSFYGDVGNIRYAGVVANQPLTVLNWLTSSVRAYALAAEPVVPWVAGKTYSSTLTNSLYYDELVWHLMLSSGSLNLNLWDADEATTQTDCEAIETDLAKLALHTDNATTITPLTRAPVPYSSSVLVSGVACNTGRRLYRVSLPRVSGSSQSVTLVLPGETVKTLVTVPADAAGVWVIHQE